MWYLLDVRSPFSVLRSAAWTCLPVPDMICSTPIEHSVILDLKDEKSIKHTTQMPRLVCLELACASYPCLAAHHGRIPYPRVMSCIVGIMGSYESEKSQPISYRALALRAGY